jgi:hypothetical protein
LGRTLDWTRRTLPARALEDGPAVSGRLRQSRDQVSCDQDLHTQICDPCLLCNGRPHPEMILGRILERTLERTLERPRVRRLTRFSGHFSGCSRARSLGRTLKSPWVARKFCWLRLPSRRMLDG